MPAENLISMLKATVRKLTGATALDVSLVDGSGNQVTSFGGSGGTSAQDGGAFTATSSQGNPMEGCFESSPTSVADGKFGVIGITTDRKLKVSGSFSSTPPALGTSTITSVAENAASTTLIAANANRLGLILENDSDSAVNVKFGTTASATSKTRKMLPRENWFVPVNYTGRVDAIWDSVPGSAPANAMLITELTA